MPAQLALGTVQFGLDYGISNSAGIVGLDEVSQVLKVCERRKDIFIRYSLRIWQE